MLIAPSSYGALSAMSANVIQGKAPKFAELSGANKLGFKVGNTLYSESEGNIKGDKEQEFSKDLKLEDFVVQTLSANDFTVSNDYFDDDGDEAHPTEPFSVGVMTYEWRQSNGLKIPQASYGNAIGCNEFSKPLLLTITLTDAQVHSKAGIPRDSVKEVLTKVYKITPESALCFAKPNQMIVTPKKTWMGEENSLWDWNVGGAQIDPSIGGGYSADFDPKNGFKVTATPAFPTTGFVNAKFRLIMTKPADNYEFDWVANPQGSIFVDDEGNVLLKSKPSGEVKISVKLKNSSIIHDYVFNPTTVWAMPKAGAGKYAWAESQCGVGGILERKDLTNSPKISLTDSSPISTNVYTRAIGGGIFNEWGWADSANYPLSGWQSGNYWTKDVRSSSSQFIVNSQNGTIAGSNPYIAPFVACKG
ncbi:hypothetical protein RCS94_01970 [Orbaceae bacterium ac157xtp]